MSRTFAMISTVVALALVVIATAPSPAFGYRDLVVDGPTYLCPGERLRYRVKVVVYRAPTVVGVYSTWFSVDEGRTVIPERHVSFVVYDRVTTRFELSGDREVPNLPPGRYEFRQAGVEVGSRVSSAYTVGFTVAGGCGSK